MARMYLEGKKFYVKNKVMFQQIDLWKIYSQKQLSSISWKNL